MANVVRTTDAQVIEVLGRDYDAARAPALTRYVKNASLIVDSVVACAAAKGVAFDSETLTEMETWLAADRYTISDRLYRSKATLSASGSWFGDGMGYRNAAVDLDTTGCLNSILARQRASSEWAGLPVSDQTPYWDRN